MNPDALLVEAAERWGTPLYVTDLDRAAANARAWADTLPGALVAYAVKANADPALLRRMAADGFGFEVVGPMELALAGRAGALPGRTVVNGVGLTDADLADAVVSGALVNAESLSALDTLVGLDGPGGIGLRINPAVEADTHAHLTTGAAGAKFGIALDEVPDALARLERAGRRLWSIGAHIGSDIRDPEPFGPVAASLMGLADRFGAHRVNLGGGFAGDPGAWATVVLRYVPAERLIVEPGRSVVADAGWLLTRVVRVQARGHLVTDAGMTEMIRPMLYGATHPVRLLAPGAPLPERDSWTVAGPVCEAGDILASGVDLGPHAGEGALLAVERAGAYGAAMASNYNGRLRPAQAVIEGGELRLSRRRETLDDLVARDEAFSLGGRG
jgi:diaminopimelate decarboxylase